MAEQPPHSDSSPLGLRHALLVFTTPVALFRRVEDTGAYGWALVILLAAVTLLGYAQVQTGLIDRSVDLKTEAQLAELENSQVHLVDRIQLREQMDAVRKQGDFNKLIQRFGVVLFAPLTMLAVFLLSASVLYAVVALTGRKPEYHTLMSIVVYAGYIDLAAYALRLAMMLAYRTTAVDTTLAMLSQPGKPSWLAAIDPFRFWYWALVAIGVSVTHQLGRRTAVAACSFLCMVGMAIRVGMEYVPK